MAVHTSAMTTPTSSATGTLKRTVSDTLRHRFPGNSIFKFVSSGAIADLKEVKQQKGLFRKRSVPTALYERFVYDPLPVDCTVSSVTSATEFVVSSATGITLKTCLVNTKNRTVCRVQVISGTTLTVVSVGDATGTFSCSAGDTLLIMAPAYEENSSNPYILMKDPTRLYNLTQISRFAVGVSGSAKDNPHYASNGYMEVKKRSLFEGFRKVEFSSMFMDRPSSTNETTTDATLGNFRSSRGLVQQAGTTWDAGGSMSHNRWLKDLSQAFDETVGMDMELTMVCGTNIFSEMVQWVNDGLIVEQKNSNLEKFGMTCRKFVTAKQPNGINIFLHDAFDRGSLAKCAFFFAAEMGEYVFLKGRDFKPQNNIQNNDVDGYKDEVIGEWSFDFIDGGQHALLLTNWY